MAGMFDDLIPQNAPKGGMFDDLVPAQAPAKESPGVLGTLGDMAASFGSGIVRGAHETVMLPVTAHRLMDEYLTPLEAKYIINPVQKMLGYEPSTVDELNGKGTVIGSVNEALANDQDAARAQLDSVLHTPTTTAGKYANTAGEFVAPGGVASKGTKAAGTLAGKVGSYATDLTRNAIVPGVLSEGAGQAAQALGADPTTEAIARIVTGVGAGIGGNVLAAASAPEAIVRRSIGEMGPDDWAKMRALKETSDRLGIPLTGPEIHSQVMNGSALTNAQRFVEGSIEGRAATAPFMSQRPGQVDSAVKRTLDTIAPVSSAPSMLAPRMNAAADAALQASPEGQALMEAITRARPGVTDMQAGQVIQPGLHQTYSDLSAARAAASDVNFEAARKATPSIPVNDLQPQSMMVQKSATRLDPNVDVFGQSEMAPTAIPAKTTTPSMISNTGPDYVQLDPRDALRDVLKMASEEKGPAGDALRASANLMFKDGAVDTSVAGMESARQNLKDMITEAQQNGRGHLVERLSRARDAMDRALSQVPEYQSALDTHAAMSKPLEPFQSPGMSSAIKRDEFNRGFVTPPEQVPGKLFAPTEAQNFSKVAGPAERKALQDRLATKIMDDVMDANGNVNHDALALSLRDNADLLNQFPEVRQQLAQVIGPSKALEMSKAGPVGQMAKAPDTQTAGNIMLPMNPMEGAANEIGPAVKALSAQDATATAGTARTNLGTRWSKASTDTQEGSKEFSGAKFSKDVAGNDERKAVLNAVLTNLPEGGTAAQQMEELLQVLHATGQRKAIGSATEFNRAVGADLGAKAGVSRAIDSIMSAGRRVFTGASDEAKRAIFRNNLGRLAEMFTSPDTIDQLYQATQRSVPIKLGEALTRSGAQSAVTMQNKPEREKK